MNQANNLAQVDPLGWLASQVESHRALSMSDAYYAQELPRVEAVCSAVAELVATLRSSRDVIATALRGAAPDFFKTDCDIAEHVQIKRIDAALRPFTGERA